MTDKALGLVASRRTVGRVGALAMLATSLVTLVTVHVLSGSSVPMSFDLVAACSMIAGVVCVLVPWDRISAAWLQLVPVLATVEIAAGIRVVGVFGNIGASYFVFVAVFCAYAFSSRLAVAGQVAFAAAASALPLFYATAPSSHTPEQVAVGIVVLVMIAGTVTVLREGLQARQRRLEEMAVRDPLTGVGNYRLLNERLAYELKRHRRSDTSLSVLLFDLDGFKEINDTIGHQMGDRVLADVARALSGAMREQDTVARQGGDEFSIIAPETEAAQAWQLAARAKRAVTAATNGSVNISVGVATFPIDAEDADRLLALADADLRHNKQPLRMRQRSSAATAPSAALEFIDITP